MLRAEFDHTLREAQAGDEAAFVRLWRDANPMLTRYLRVAGVSDLRATALGAWGRVVRELGSFTGDEITWRGWLLACAREQVEDLVRRRGRGSGPHRAGRAGALTAIEELSVASRMEPTTLVEPAELRGINDTIAAIRELPLGQGEILVLRLLGELPVATVAGLVGTDVVAVRRSEDRAVERLGAERELIAWSLAAPALPEELADQRSAMAAFRNQRTTRPPAAGAARVVALSPGPEVGKPPTIVRSRAALFCIAAISASAMSAGALSAAAYVDILPGGLQHVMHTVIGAPQPGESAQPRASSSQRPLTNPGATAMLALCRAWSAQSSKGPARQQSAAFAGLVAAAGGAVNVDAYCASVVATSTPTVRTPGPRPVSAGKAGLSPASPRGTTPHSTKPTRTEPAKTQPAKAQPAKAQSAKAHQAKAPTAETQARTAPAKAAPGTPTAASHSAAPARSRAQPMMSASGSHHP